MAKPRGSPLGSKSGITGIPVDEEKRTVIGVDGAEKWGAEEREAAVGVGMKVPVSMIPLA